jgi:hypothetical protein
MTVMLAQDTHQVWFVLLTSFVAQHLSQTMQGTAPWQQRLTYCMVMIRACIRQFELSRRWQSVQCHTCGSPCSTVYSACMPYYGTMAQCAILASSTQSVTAAH